MVVSTAAIAGASAPPSQEALQSSALLRHLVPLTQVAKKVVDTNPGLEQSELASKVIYESVKLQVDNIVSTGIIQDNWKGVTSPFVRKGDEQGPGARSLLRHCKGSARRS